MAITRTSDQEKRLKTLRSQLYGKESIPDFLTKPPIDKNPSSDQEQPKYSDYRFKNPHGVYASNTPLTSHTLKKDLLRIVFLGGLTIVSVVVVYLLLQSQFQSVFSFTSSVKLK